MISKPKIETREAVHSAAIRMQVPIPFGSLIPPANDEVEAWLAERGQAPSGAPFIRYLTTDMARKLDIEVGWLVAAAIPGDARIVTGTFPAGRYAVLVYTGPYEGTGLVEATAALLAWAEENHVPWQKFDREGVEWWEARIEYYLVDPGQEPDPEKWQTELAFLVAEA